MAKLIRPPETKDMTRFLRMLFLKTEREIVNEISRKRAKEYVDYADVAALERVQETLRNMVDESFDYVPQMVEKIFYYSEKDAAGYRNARTLTAMQLDTAQVLANNLLGEIMDASETAYKTVQQYYAVARLESDPFRSAALNQVLRQEAAGIGWTKTSAAMAKELKDKGVTAFVDKAGRKWSLYDYCNMAARTTARQAEVAAVLTADDHDLYQIVKIGSTCPVCAPLEGRVYSKSGKNPDYPPLSVAFGKVDPAGPDDMMNTYLNIHPSCLHSLIRYTTIGKTEEQIQKDKDFSSIEKNPLTNDPRSKKQIRAYQEKVKKRRKLLADIRQHKEYRAVLGNDVPKDFEKFREMKYNEPEKWNVLKKTRRTYAEIDKKDWTDDFKIKSKQAFKRFKDNGIILSSHALGRIPRLNKRGFPDVKEKELISLIKGKANYSEKTNRIVYYDDVLQIAAIENTDSGDIVSVVRRKTIKEEWNEI